MAKTSFIYSCGHRGSVTAHNSSTADSRAAWNAKGLCWECQKAAETATVQASADAAGLAALTGSPKQIAYGLSMRARHLPDFQKAMAALVSPKGLPPAAAGEWADALIAMEAAISAETSAKFWIEAPADWTYWILSAIKSRGLAPTAFVRPAV